MAIRQTMLSIGAMALAVTALAAVSGCAADPDPLSDWDASQLQGGWRAEQMTGASVYGENGEDLGEVADIIVGPDDRIQALIVEVGSLAIGEVPLRVPWYRLDLTPGAKGVRASIDEDNAADFSLFGDDVATRPRAWRVSEVIGDYVRLAGNKNYGIVDDLVFSKAANSRQS